MIDSCRTPRLSARVQIRPQIMARDASCALHIEDSFGRDAGPLRNSLRRDPQNASDANGSADVLLGLGKCVCHAEDESISYINTQVSLSSYERKPFGILRGMKTTGDRIKYLRKFVLKLKQRELADRLKVTRGAVGNWELNKGIKREHLIQISDEFGVSADWLMSGRGTPPDAVAVQDPVALLPPPKGNASAPEARPLMPRVLVPVYGRAAGGDEGRFILNGEKVGEVFAPASLEYVPDAYSVYVHGTSMEPRYMAGEGVWVHPHRPTKGGDFVVVQLSSGDETPYGFVKRLVSFNAKELVLDQLNPPEGSDRLMRFPAADVISIHKIIGSFEG
jgi:phage repressor protein C with HTH and peptisase S24 domain